MNQDSNTADRPKPPGTCKTCKWWGAFHRPGTTGARCKLPHHGTGSDFIDPTWDRAESPARKPGEGYGDIHTGPDFGCVHHDPKEEVTDE